MGEREPRFLAASAAPDLPFRAKRLRAPLSAAGTTMSRIPERCEPRPNARFAFVCAVGLRSLGQPKLASRMLTTAARCHPADVAIASALLQEALQRQDRAQALDLARHLAALRPDDPRFADPAGRLGR